MAVEQPTAAGPKKHDRLPLCKQFSTGGVQNFVVRFRSRPVDAGDAPFAEQGGHAIAAKAGASRNTVMTSTGTGGGNIEHVTGHRPSSHAIRRYVVSNKEASRRAQAARIPNKGRGKV